MNRRLFMRTLMAIVAAALALLAVVGSDAAARESSPPSRTFSADQPSLDLVPSETRFSRNSKLEVDLYVPASIEVARLALFVPVGYGLDLARPAGDTIGTFVAWGS